MSARMLLILLLQMYIYRCLMYFIGLAQVGYIKLFMIFIFLSFLIFHLYLLF